MKKECQIHPAYKERILKAKDIDTKVTGRSTGHPVRALRNDMTKRYLELEQAGASMEELEYLTLGALRRAVTEGDVLNGSVMAGQIAGMIHEETDCRTLIRQLIEDAEKRRKVWREKRKRELVEIRGREHKCLEWDWIFMNSTVQLQQ